MNTPLRIWEGIGGDKMKVILWLMFWPIMMPIWLIKKLAKTPTKKDKPVYTTKKVTTQYSTTTSPTKEQMKRERNKMTNAVRERIKARDNYTCQKCGISLFDEPHLLLEVDHIIPVAKGGKTVNSNLQCLCWKCNRSKGATTQFFTGAIPCWKCARHDTAFCRSCPNGEYFKEES